MSVLLEALRNKTALPADQCWPWEAHPKPGADDALDTVSSAIALLEEARAEIALQRALTPHGKHLLRRAGKALALMHV